MWLNAELLTTTSHSATSEDIDSPQEYQDTTNLTSSYYYSDRPECSHSLSTCSLVYYSSLHAWARVLRILAFQTMTENTNAGIRHRAACDRCSAQKLRCPRRSGLEACERCAKGHHPCVYSPFRPKAHSKDRDDSSRRVPMLRDEILSSVEKQVAPAPKRKRTASATGKISKHVMFQY